MNPFQSLIRLLAHPENQGKPLQTTGKLIWWKCNQLFFHIPAIVTLLETTKIICDPHSSYGSYVVYARYPEYEEMKFMEDYLKSTDTVVDVGANIGALTLIAATKARKGMVFAFEPTLVAKTLQSNIALNNFKHVKVYSEVVSDKNGFEYFSESRESEVSHIASTKTKGTRKLKAITLDTFFTRQKIRMIDFLKVDVEGAELKIFNGAKKLFKQGKIDLVVFEFGKKTTHYGYTFEQLYDFFNTNQYDLYHFVDSRLNKIDRSFSTTYTDNLVAVRRKSTASKRVKRFL